MIYTPFTSTAMTVLNISMQYGSQASHVCLQLWIFHILLYIVPLSAQFGRSWSQLWSSKPTEGEVSPVIGCNIIFSARYTSFVSVMRLNLMATCTGLHRKSYKTAWRMAVNKALKWHIYISVLTVYCGPAIFFNFMWILNLFYHSMRICHHQSHEEGIKLAPSRQQWR